MVAVLQLGACGESAVILGAGDTPGADGCTHPEVCGADSTWRLETRDGVAEMAPGRSGEQSATHFSVSARGGYARWARRLSMPLVDGELHLAALFKVAKVFSLSDWVVVMEAKGSAGKVSLDLAPSNSWQLYTDSLSTSSGEPPVVRDVWTCATLSMAIAKDGWASARLADGTALKVDPADILQTGGITEIYFGLTTSADQIDPVQLTVDELRVSSQPVSCP